MPLYVVVHHPQDPNQPWGNAWLDCERIDAIQTTKAIGKLCREAEEQGERIFVHRCGWGDCPPTICCSAEVEAVADIDKASALVRFKNAIWIDCVPPKSPIKHQNFYIS